MHYRNGREAKNGDKIVQIGVDDVAAMLKEKGLAERPAGK